MIDLWAELLTVELDLWFRVWPHVDQKKVFGGMELAFAPTGQFLGGFKRLFKAIFLCAGPIYFVRVIKWVIFFLFKKKYRLVQRVLLFWLNQVLFFFRSSDICICIVHSCFTVTENSKISETSADGFPLQSRVKNWTPQVFFLFYF